MQTLEITRTFLYSIIAFVIKALFHGLDGSIKLLMLIAWTGFAFAFMDARVFMGMIAVGLFILNISKLPAKAIWPLFLFIFI